jgi:hypothetical protein
MSSNDPEKDLIDALKNPFDPKVLHWRVGATNKEKTSGIALAYINARDAEKRFDEVMGLNWANRHPYEGCCEIGLKINNEWIWRANGAGETDIEGEKGRYSDSFKRAATMWGVGRYLYYLPNIWVPIKAQGRSHVLAQTPNLPAWALPKATKP